MIEKAEKIDGWMSPVELAFLAELARNANYILEFGCYKGRSTRALADNTNGVVYAVDPWDGGYVNNDESQATWLDTKNAYNHFLHNLSDHILIGKVITVKNFSWAFKSDLKFDFIFIDADHRYDAVLDDIKLAFKYIKRGGVIAGHDYGRSDWPGVKRAVDELFPNVETLDTIWYQRDKL